MDSQLLDTELIPRSLLTKANAWNTRRNANALRINAKYEPRFCEMLLKHMAQRRSFASFAKVARVERATLYDWLEEHEDFRFARALGDSEGLYSSEGKFDAAKTNVQLKKAMHVLSTFWPDIWGKNDSDNSMTQLGAAIASQLARIIENGSQLTQAQLIEGEAIEIVPSDQSK